MRHRFQKINLTVRHEFISSKGVFALADKTLGRQPNADEIKIGNTTYIVNGYFASNGVTVSEKIKRLLDKETKRKSC